MKTVTKSYILLELFILSFAFGVDIQRAAIVYDVCSRALRAPHTSPSDKPFNVTRCVNANMQHLEDY